MKIIIVGAGRVGSSVAESLSEQNDITVIDADPARVADCRIGSTCAVWWKRRVAVDVEAGRRRRRGHADCGHGVRRNQPRRLQDRADLFNVRRVSHACAMSSCSSIRS
jgi:glycine/D-amino acid oxidase-like deaminating enzyme